MRPIFSCAFSLGMCTSFFILSAPASQKVVNIYNWSNYIPSDVIENFENDTGIKVNYDVFDSNEMLEAKLLAGNSGYDVVVPTDSPFLIRQIQANIYQPLDKSLLSNYKNLDQTLLSEMAHTDPESTYSIPYVWGTLGIGYNVQKVKALLGDDAPVNSWELIFNPEYLSKLHDCGVAVSDTLLLCYLQHFNTKAKIRIVCFLKIISLLKKRGTKFAHT